MVRKIEGGTSVPSSPTGEAPQTATVRQGDTISTVASRHEVTEKQLLESNPQIKDPKQLSPGMELNLPQQTQAGRTGGGGAAAGTGAASGGSAAAGSSAQPASVAAGRAGAATAVTLQSGSSGPHVKNLQHDLNVWRKENGRPEIAETGKFNNETKEAVLDFQKANGLKEDGIAGIRTRTRLDLENNANFKQLNDATKTQVRNQMTSYEGNVTKLQNLSQLATSDGFRQLNTGHQKQMLDALDKRPTDKNFGRELTTLANSATFRGLSDADKTKMINDVSTHGGAAAYVKSLTNDQLLTLAESPSGPNQLAALREAIQSGGINKAEKAQLDRVGAATFTPGVGMTVSGSAADQATFLHMTRREMLNSPSFRTLMNTQNADAAHPLTINVGRSQAGTFVDAFNGGGNQTIDLDDFQQWPENPPATNPHAMTRGQNLVHAMAEARQGALGNGYDVSHRRAIQAENQYRADIGQTSRLRLPPNDTTTNAAGNTVFQYNNGYTEEIQTDASGTTITGIVRHNP